jgi:ribosomal protein L27
VFATLDGRVKFDNQTRSKKRISILADGGTQAEAKQ